MRMDVDEPRRHASDRPGQTLFEFIRHWSRKSNGPSNDAIAQNGRYVLVVEAVDSAAKRGSSTINGIAAEIGIDQSGASRLVKEAVLAGYLEMQASPDDARARRVVLSTAGQRLLIDAHRWQEEVFLTLTPGWDQEERQAFQRAMLKLLKNSREMEM